MEISPQSVAMLMMLLLVSTLIGGCFPTTEEKENSTVTWNSHIRPEFFLPNDNLTTYRNSIITYYSAHSWLPGGDNRDYYGAKATLDVYGFDLEHGQASGAAIWVINRGDGQPSSLNGIQFGWHIFPWLYKDSHTHFYISWISSETSGKICVNMNCPGFHMTSPSIAPGQVISPLSHVGDQKSYVTLRIFKERYSGDWHIQFGANGEPEPVGYFSKSLFPGIVDNPVEISFGGFVVHKKPRVSPPMGSGYVSTSWNVASFSSLKLIDGEENDYFINKDLPSTSDMKGCYTPTSIYSSQFFYGGPDCVD